MGVKKIIMNATPIRFTCSCNTFFFSIVFHHCLIHSFQYFTKQNNPNNQKNKKRNGTIHSSAASSSILHSFGGRESPTLHFRHVISTRFQCAPTHFLFNAHYSSKLYFMKLSNPNILTSYNKMDMDVIHCGIQCLTIHMWPLAGYTCQLVIFKFKFKYKQLTFSIADFF